MTEALRQAHIALTAIFTHPTLELSDFMRDKLTAAIAAAEAELSQPARVGLTEAQVQHLIDTKHFDPYYGLKARDRVCIDWYKLGLRDGERAHNIPAAQEGK